MSKAFILYAGCALALFSCKKKETQVYNPAIVRSINVQSVALETIYQLVNIHIFDAADYTYYAEHCFTRTADTTGTTVSDTVSVNADEYCPYARGGVTSGSYASVYTIPAPGTTTNATITLQQFETNGYSISGNIHYTYNAATGAAISVTDFVLTDAQGSTTIIADLHLAVDNTENYLAGTISGNGSGAFDYAITEKLKAYNGNVSYINPNNFLMNSGKAVLSVSGISLRENFGEGQLDNFAVYQDQSDIRKAFVLPQL